ncbi:hypothetical protein MPC4_170011 [Methylocella tundrae]|uniref:Uncharacterized protein n=1 Tax=Methylocella tundrae TaxID=227605 RepID=A0A8B6M577_METTU|nr:hypothetical protein [Methylocella tundrae]VTZ49480.1 hypothetical protein MPC4_170011 [Methylocella tundrae]
MTLEDLRASAPPEIVAYLDKRANDFRQHEKEDGAVGVQARVTPLLMEAFTLCYMHEKRRAMAKGSPAIELVKGLAGSMSVLLINLVSNSVDKEDEIVALGTICEVIFDAAAKGLAGEFGSPFVQESVDYSGGLA